MSALRLGQADGALSELQRLGQAFDAAELDGCKRCGELICEHSDADYIGWSDGPHGITPAAKEA